MREDYLKRTDRELRIRNYSPRTRDIYLTCLRIYFDFKKNDLDKLDEENIKNFLDEIERKGRSGQTLNVYINAIKFFYSQICDSYWKPGIKFSKKPRRLPTVLTKEEIKAIIRVTPNLKHRLVLTLAYGGGLRLIRSPICLSSA